MITPQQQQNIQAILKQANYTPPPAPAPNGQPLQTGNDMIQAKLQQLKTQQAAQPNPLAPIGSPESQVAGDVSDFASQTNSHAANIVQDLSQKPSFTGATDVMGNVAGEAGDIIGGLVKLGSQATMPKPVYDFVSNLLSSGVKTAINSNAGQNLAQIWGELSAKYPDATKNVGNLLGITGLVAGTPDVNVGELADVAKGGAQAAGSMVGDTASNVGQGIVNTTSKFVQAPINAAQDLATPIDQNVLKILQNPNPNTASTLKNMFSSAKEAISTTGAPSPLEIAGKNSFGNAMDSIKSQLGDAGKVLNDSLAENGTKTVDTSAVKNVFNEGLESRLGTKVDVTGDLSDAPGRKSIITSSPSDSRMVKMVDQALYKLGSNPTVQEVNDTVDSLQGELYKAPMKGAEALNGKTQGFVKQIVGQLNGVAKDAAGPEYSEANETYANLKDMQNELNTKMGTNYKNAGAQMKRIFSPSDGGIKSLVTRLERQTGEPIFHDATLAKFAMDSVGDPRAISLLDKVGKVADTGFYRSMINFVKNRLNNPEGVATRIVNLSSK